MNCRNLGKNLTNMKLSFGASKKIEIRNKEVGNQSISFCVQEGLRT